MAILLTKAGRVELARSFHRDIKNANDYFHFVLGRTTEWEDEESPETPLDSEKYIKEFRNNIIFSQAVSSADICHLARRIDWASGSVYDSYDDSYSADNPSYTGATTLSDANFYVITDENKVYKCIDNNSNAQSVDKPTSTSTNTFILDDGYTWKFLFQVSASDETKFLDIEYIPVRKLTGNPEHDVNGQIDGFTKIDGGSGYTSAPTVNINGDGVGASATAVLTGDEVSSINVDSNGTGYSFAYVTFSNGGGGSGAEYSVILGDADSLPILQSNVEAAAIPGTIDKIIIDEPGQDYVVGDVIVNITGDGTGAEATVEIAEGTGAITAVSVTDVGTGYTNATISITNSLGTNVSAQARAVLSPIDGHGSNPVKELFGSTVGITVSISENVINDDLFLGNDFRQVGLMKNIYEYAGYTGEIWTENTGTAAFIANVDSSASYAADDIVTTDDGGEFRVIQIRNNDDDTTYDVYLQPIIPLISNSSILYNVTQDISSLSINSATDPEISVSTGEVVYIENRPAISRSEDQVETIKALVNF